MIYHISQTDMDLTFEDGFAETELLPGVYPYVKTYRGVIKAGTTLKTPEKYEKKLCVYCLTDGRGYIATPNNAYPIEELSFYIANFEEDYFIRATSDDLVYTKFVIDMCTSDWKKYNRSHLTLPYYCPISKSREYTQDCKTPGTRSFNIVYLGQLARILFGVVKGFDCGGTIEKGHPSVAQWNVILDNTELTLTVQDEGSVIEKGGDFSFVPAGPDHSLVANKGKAMNYIWFEHLTDEYDTDHEA